MSTAGLTERERDAARKAAGRAANRDLAIPDIKDAGRRKACEQDDCEWLQTYVADVFYSPFTPHQRTIIEDCGEVLRYGTKKCKAAPRGDGKSSIVKYLALKYALTRQTRFPLIVAATSSKAKKTLGSVQRRLAARATSPLAEDYPLECHIARYVDPWPSRARNITANGMRPIHVEWGSDWFIVPTWEDEEPLGPIIAALGITSDDLQGCNVYDQRPDFVMLDDLDSRDSLASEDGVMAGKIEEAIDKTIAGLGGQSRRLGQFMLCTITSRKSAAFKYSDPAIKPAFSGERIAAIIKWPDNVKLWEQYIELRQAGQRELNEKKRPKDVFGRGAHAFYLVNREEMDAGAVLSNPFNFDRELLADGTQKQVSALQRCYDYIADTGMDSFLTEHQNQPPEDETTQTQVLTAYHIQNNCLSGLEKREVPEGTVCITRGGDVQKLGLHHVTIAWNESGAGSIIDYDFYEFLTAGKKAADCELLIMEGLFAWYEAQGEIPFTSAGGEIFDVDLTLIDQGWKDESWNAQPVQLFCAQVGFNSYIPSKGQPNYRRPMDSDRIIIGDNWHISFQGGIPAVIMNSDHWKQKVREGLLLEGGQPGALTLHLPIKKEDGRRENHMSYSKHILNESWQTRPTKGFGGMRSGFFNPGQKPNHYGDATYQAICARSMRRISVFSPAAPVAAAVERIPDVQYDSADTRRNRW